MWNGNWHNETYVLCTRCTWTGPPSESQAQSAGAYRDVHIHWLKVGNNDSGCSEAQCKATGSQPIEVHVHYASSDDTCARYTYLPPLAWDGLGQSLYIKMTVVTSL